MVRCLINKVQITDDYAVANPERLSGHAFIIWEHSRGWRMKLLKYGLNSRDVSMISHKSRPPLH